MYCRAWKKQRRSAGWAEGQAERDGPGGSRGFTWRGTWGTWACQGAVVGCMTADPNGWGASPSLVEGHGCSRLPLLFQVSPSLFPSGTMQQGADASFMLMSLLRHHSQFICTTGLFSPGVSTLKISGKCIIFEAHFALSL